MNSGIFNKIVRNIFMLFLTISLNSCYVWIMRDYFGEKYESEKDYEKLIFESNQDLNQLKNEIYLNLVQRDTVLHFYDYLFINPYSKGLGNYLIVKDSNIYDFDSTQYSQLIDSLKIDYSKKYKIEKNQIRIYRYNIGKKQSKFYVDYPWILLTQKEYIDKFIKESILIEIGYKKFDLYQYECELIANKSNSYIKLNKINTSTIEKWNGKDNKLHEKALKMFKKKILKKIL